MMPRTLIAALVFIVLAAGFATGIALVFFPRETDLPVFPPPTPTPVPVWPGHHGIELDSP